jgi:hypothetical protein
VGVAGQDSNLRPSGYELPSLRDRLQTNSVGATIEGVLFDDRPRTDINYSFEGEGRYRFLDRVDDPYFAQVRDALNGWASRYPPASLPALRARLLGSDGIDACAAGWELAVHELFARDGWHAEVETLTEGGTRPDFRMTRGEQTLVVEARLVTGLTRTQQLQGRRRESMYAALDDVSSARFALRVRILQEGPSGPPGKALRRRVEQWLDTLDPQQVTARLLDAGSFDGATAQIFEQSGWRLEVSALPLKADRPARRRPNRAVGVRDIESWAGSPTEATRRALRTKGSRYQGLKCPLVIAIAQEQMAFRMDDITAAVFGTDVIHDGTPLERLPTYDSGRYWSPTRGRRVSSVLVAIAPAPWSLPRLALRQLDNPWAHHRFTAEVPWPRLAFDDGQQAFVASPGRPSADLFGLPHDWPTGQPFAD